MRRPLGKRVWISRFDFNAVTQSGIVYSKKGEPLHHGRVEQDYRSEDISLPKGTHILFEPNRAFQVGTGNDLVVKEENIVAVCSTM